MKYLKVIPIVLIPFFILLLHESEGAKEIAKPPAMVSKRCLTCHAGYKEMKDILAGNFKSRSRKAKSIQVKINNRMQLVKYTPDTTVENVPNIKALKEPMPLRVHFERVGPDLVATEIVVKPKMKVPDEQLLSTEELAKLVALGPEKGGYSLVDSRPPIKYAEGHIPTAISIPFPKMKQLKNKLPKDKDRLLIFYCEGLR